MRYLRYLQTPYLHRGRDFSGADCFGLIRLFYQHELGIILPDFTEEYSEEWWKERNYFLELYREYNFKPVAVPSIGDVLLFKNGTSGVGHCGVALTEGMFIHMTTKGCGIESYQRVPYAAQLHSCYEYVVPRKNRGKRKP